MDMEKKRFSLTLGALGAAAIIGSTGINVFANDKVSENNINYVLNDDAQEATIDKEEKNIINYKSIDESKALYESVKADLQSVTDEFNLISPYVKATDKATMTDEQIRDKYTQTYNLTKSFNYIKNNLDDIMPKVIQNSPDTFDATYIRSKKEQIIRGLTYLHRYYNFPVGNSTAFEKLLFNMQEINGQSGDALDLVINVGNNTGIYLLGNRTSETYKNFIGIRTGLTTLSDFIGKMSQLDGCASGKEFLLKRSKAVFSESGKNSDIFEKSKRSVNVSNFLLPLLTLSEESIYILSTDNTTTVGLTATYGDKATTKTLADANAKEQQAFLDSLKRISGRGDVLDSYPDVLVIDTLASKTKPNQSKRETWSPEYGQGTNSGVAELIVPGYLYAAYSMVGAQAAKGENGSSIRYYIQEVLKDQDVSVYTHELTHIFDKNVWIGAGRRAGTGSETYARGIFESINNTQTPTEPFGPVFSLNTAYELGDNRIQNKSPERFQSSNDVDEYMKGLMNVVNSLDVIEAQEILKLSDDDKAILFNKVSLEGDKSTFSNITKEEASRLKTIDDLVDNNIVSGRLVPRGNSTIGTISNGANGEYYVVPLFEGIYGAAINNNGYSGEILFRRYAWELMGEVGWNDGFIPWISDKYATDAEAVQNIVKSDYATFKKKIYNETASKLNNLKATNKYNDYEAMRQAIAEALQKDLAGMKQDKNQGTYSLNIRSVRNVKTNIFQDYLLGTNDFRESIYKDEPIVPENKTHIVNYEWTNAPSTETIPESGKTYNNKDSAIAAKDTKYTSTYETVVNDKVYKFSGWTESIKDKIITYTGSWTTTDIIDLSKAVVEVTPAQATFKGGSIVPTVKVTYNNNEIDSSKYVIKYLDKNSNEISYDNLIHVGNYKIVISPKENDKYYKGTAQGTFEITKKTDQSGPIFGPSEKGIFSTDSNGMITYHAPTKVGCEYKLDNGAWQDSNVFNNIQKESTHTVYIRYKGTSDVAESASTTITIKSPSNTALTELENAGFKKVNDLKATDYYNIETVARKDGFVDIAGASQENNANVNLWSNNGTAAQKFYFDPQSNGTYQIKTDVTDGTSVLEVDSGKVALGTNIKQNSDRNQNGTYFIVMKNDKNQYVFVVADKDGNPAVASNGKVQLMDLTGAKTGNGTNIWTWEYIKGSNTQMWNLINTKSANEARAKGLTLVKDFVEGEYNIVSATNNNFALDVSGGKQSNGTNVGIWERNYSDAEKFRIEKASENGEYYIRTAASGYKSSLDVSSASPNRGANVHQWASNNSNAQIWKIYKHTDGSYVFINSVNGKALDIAGGNVRKGQNVGVWDVNGIKNAQHWKIESVTTFDAANPELEKITDISSLGISENDWVQLGSIADSSFRLDISSGIDANGQNVHIWKSNGTNAQKFRIKKLTNGNFVIQTKISNGTKVIDISGGNTNSTTNILQWSSNNTNAQQWNIYRVKGTDKLIFKQASGYCVMDTCGANMKNGSNIWLWFYAKDNGAQQWKIYK